MVAMHMTSHQVMTRLLKLDPAWTLEEMWSKGKRTWDAKDSLDMTPEETVLGSALSKMALNVCLMATAYGVRCLGPSNPSHYERLKRHVKVAAKKGRERLERAEMDLFDGSGALCLRRRSHFVPSGDRRGRQREGRLVGDAALEARSLALATVWAGANGAATDCDSLRAGQCAQDGHRGKIELTRSPGRRRTGQLILDTAEHDAIRRGFSAE
jgi:hypothetical protein